MKAAFLILLKWTVVVILLVLAAGIVLARYSAGKYLAIGAAILLGVSLLVSFLGWKRVLAGFAIVGILVVLGGLPLFFLLRAPRLIPINALLPFCMNGQRKTEMHITVDQLNVEVENYSREEFLVTEQLTYNQAESECVNGNNGPAWVVINSKESLVQDLPARRITGTKHGFLVHEVTFPSLIQGLGYQPDLVKVTVNKLPYNSFYDAQYSKDLNEDEFLGEVQVTWDTVYTPEGIRFAYLPFPFYDLRFMVTPFIELSKSDNWVLSGLGLLTSWIFLQIVKPLASDFLKDRIKKGFRNDEQAPTQRRVRQFPQG